MITFSRLWEEHTQEEARLLIREKKMGATEDQALTIQRRSLKRWGNSWRTSYPYYHLDKKWCCYEWRIWWSWRIKKESMHETNKDKYSVVISWYCLVMHLFIFSWCVMHVWVSEFILLNCTWWVRSQWSLLYSIPLLLIQIETNLLAY